MTTKDFGLITTLTAKGIHYLDYTVDEMGRIFFRFQDCPEVRAIENGFFRNAVSVPVLDFINAQTTMKTLVFEIRRKDSANGYKFNGSRTVTTNCA